MNQESTPNLIQQVENADQAFKVVLSDVLNTKKEIKAKKSMSIGSNKKFKEILNYNFVISNPIQRLIADNNRQFNLPGAVARFVWMMAANNRLADIEFYMPKVANFTDDDITIPGSNYGARMFNSLPGLNQIEAIIKRLKKDHSTRRAAVSIYHPIDAIRESHDIPCTFGLFYHIRDGKLVSTIVMRSNNAFILLPYNVFEFSLLAEIIAKEVGVNMGAMYYNALSMHIYAENYEGATEIIGSRNTSSNINFPPMPSTPKPMGEVMKLIRLEAEIRHKSAGINNLNIDFWLEDIISIGDREKDKIKLDDYWKQFYYLLLYHIVSKKTVDIKAVQKVANLINEPFKKYLKQEKIISSVNEKQLDLFGDRLDNSAYSDVSFTLGKLHSFETLCSDYNEQEKMNHSGREITIDLFLRLRKELVGDMTDLHNIAARGGKREIAKEEFLEIVNKQFS